MSLTTAPPGASPLCSYPPPPQLWLWPNLLCLDAPLIAVLWQALLTRDLAVKVSPGEPFVLALCVWLVYVADRVLDVLRPLTGEWEPARKAFCRRHIRLASAAALCVLLLIIPLAGHLLRRSTFYAGLTLTVPLLSYFAVLHLSPFHHRARWPRELVVAALFTSGTFLAIWTGNHKNASLLWAPAILFFLLCWANCSAIETWEWQRDLSKEKGAPGRSTLWAAQHLPSLGLAIVCLAALMAYLALAPIGFSAAALLSGMALAAVAARRPRSSINALRVSVDLALCTPLLMLLPSFSK